MLKGAQFDEAHWLEIAIESPHLCDCEYAVSSLRAAANLALRCGLDDVAWWLDQLTAPVFIPGNESRRHRGTRLRESVTA